MVMDSPPRRVTVSPLRIVPLLSPWKEYRVPGVLPPSRVKSTRKVNSRAGSPAPVTRLEMVSLPVGSLGSGPGSGPGSGSSSLVLVKAALTVSPAAMTPVSPLEVTSYPPFPLSVTVYSVPSGRPSAVLLWPSLRVKVATPFSKVISP